MSHLRISKCFPPLSLPWTHRDPAHRPGDQRSYIHSLLARIGCHGYFSSARLRHRRRGRRLRAARRLSEDRLRVLLIEPATKTTRVDPHMPIAFGALFAAIVDWTIPRTTSPDATAANLSAARQGARGSSSITRWSTCGETGVDYDGWRERGCAGWGWATCCPASCAPRTTSAAPTSSTGGGPTGLSDLPAPQPDQ